MKYREIARQLRALGCVESARKGSGSHRKWHNPATRLWATVPDWGSKDLKTGTLRAIVKQLGLNWDDFVRA